MAEHVPPTEDQLGEIERLAKKRDWDGYNAFLLRCIAEIRGLRARETALAEWCDAQRAVPKEKFLRYANQEYNEGYRDAMAAVVRRIREAL